MLEDLNYRDNLLTYPVIPAPFYLYGIGVSEVTKQKRLWTHGREKPFVELIFGLEGTGEITLYKKTFQCHPGDFFYYLPEEDHQLIALSDSWKYQWVCFDGPLAASIMFACNLPRFKELAHPVPEKLFIDLKTCINDHSPRKIRHMGAVIMEILSYVEDPPENDIPELTVRHCVDYITNHLTDPNLTVDLLCEELKLSRATLTHLFYDSMGCTPGRYIRNNRLTMAIALLKGTNLPIAEVSQKCGFTAPRTFSKFISRATHRSPREVRNNI